MLLHTQSRPAVDPSVLMEASKATAVAASRRHQRGQLTEQHSGPGKASRGYLEIFHGSCSRGVESRAAESAHSVPTQLRPCHAEQRPADISRDASALLGRHSPLLWRKRKRQNKVLVRWTAALAQGRSWFTSALKVIPSPSQFMPTIDHSGCVKEEGGWPVKQPSSCECSDVLSQLASPNCFTHTLLNTNVQATSYVLSA